SHADDLLVGRGAPSPDLLDVVRARGSRDDRVQHVERVAARDGRPVAWPAWVDPEVVAALKANGVDRPWEHQALAADLVHDRRHHSLLPGHERWGRFLRGLELVVVDECHHYRGVFGSHVAAVLRRLRRVAARYGAHPTFVLASATVSAPAEHAERLTGLPFVAVTDDASPRGATDVVLWEPPLLPGGGEHGAPTRRGAGAE